MSNLSDQTRGPSCHVVCILQISLGKTNQIILGPPTKPNTNKNNLQNTDYSKIMQKNHKKLRTLQIFVDPVWSML